MSVDNLKKIRLGVIGYGYWSPKVIRGFLGVPSVLVAAVCEKDKSKHEAIKQQVGEIKIYQRYEEMMADTSIDAVLITTTVSSHYRIAKLALENKKHVLVEKPMTEMVWQAEVLINLANKHNLVLMVDHTFIFMPAVQKLKEMINQGVLGQVHTVLANRSNLGLVQKDIDVLYDLAPHDLSIMYYLFNEEPVKVISTGAAPFKHSLQSKHYNAVGVTSLHYRSGLFVNFIHSWLAPVKDRRMIFIGYKKAAVFDMLDQAGALKIYDTSVKLLDNADPYGPWFDYKDDGLTVVDLPVLAGDDLQRMASEFAAAILEKRQPITNAKMGKAVVKILMTTKGLKDRMLDKIKTVFINLKQYGK